VIQIGGDLGTEVHELKLRLDPRHWTPPIRVLVRSTVSND
jgi:hypothetical protein